MLQAQLLKQLGPLYQEYKKEHDHEEKVKINTYECCICMENFATTTSPFIPCYSGHTILNHTTEFLCGGCYNGIKKNNNLCPLCRNKLTTVSDSNL